MKKNSHKNVTVERATFTKAEREYIKGIVHNFALDKWTDQDIVNYLHSEKEIDISRSAITKIRNQIEQQAEKWYIELKQSRYKYIATYKERVDSLFSYQKILHEIISSNKKPEVQVRAVSELHSIEMSIFNLWKQLPNLSIVDNRTDNVNSRDGISRADMPVIECYCYDIIKHCKCKYCLHVWCPNTNCEHSVKGCRFQPYDEVYTWIQYTTCTRWFKTQKILDVHHCLPTIDDGHE